MNESIDKDSQEIAINRHQYLEDQHVQFQNYEYDEDAFTDSRDQDFSGQKQNAIRDSITRSRKNKAIEQEGSVDTQEDVVQPALPEVEIGLLFFCMYETDPQTFIRFVLWAKIFDVVLYLLIFGTYMVWGQAVISLVATYLCLKHYRGLASRRLYNALLWLMIIHQVFTSGVFVVQLIDSTKGLESGYVIFLAFSYLFWLTQGMAWDFQLVDNMDAILEQPLLQAQEKKEPPRSLEDSIGQGTLPEEKQTKSKLKKRSSQVNTDPNDEL